MKIENKSAVITGAAGGIGLAVAEKLAEKNIGAMALVDLSDNCQATAEKINKFAGRNIAMGFGGDVTDEKFRKSVFQTMEDAHDDTVRICIPAAGITKDGLAVKVRRESGETALYPESDFQKIIDVDLVHPAYWAMETIACIADNRNRRGMNQWNEEEDIQGVIILIGSVSSRGNRGQVGYAAAKSGLTGVSATLNLEGLYYGVQTKIIHPGFVDTPMTELIDKEYFEKKLKPLIGLGRKITPEEIADIICAMIENPVISGEVWADAGMTPLA